MMTVAEEAKAVKKELTAQGYKVSVQKGKGTSRHWIMITLLDSHLVGDEWFQMNDAVVKIAQEVTGRHGDYNGDISFYAL